MARRKGRIWNYRWIFTQIRRMAAVLFISVSISCATPSECPHHRDAVPTVGGGQRSAAATSLPTTAGGDADCTDLTYHFKYRSADGVCNNFESPDWGAANTPMVRLIPAEYEDGSGTPIGFFDLKYSGYKKPNTREVSQDIFRTHHAQQDIRHNALLSHWGQFIAHDLTLASETAINCTVEFFDREGCFNIPIPREDSRMPRFGIFPFKRSDSCMDFGRRQQMNKLTAFLDGSQIYGSSQRVANKLRGSGGYLRVNAFHRSPADKTYLPFDDLEIDVTCFRNKSNSAFSIAESCFLAGDRRTNEQLMLTSLHTVMNSHHTFKNKTNTTFQRLGNTIIREHNRIVAQLSRINPEWSPETLFQEARKIVGAITQRITFDDWLPGVLGPVGVHLLGEYRGYRRDVNPGIANSVSAAALRFGHAFVVPILKRLDESYAPDRSGDVRLRDAFFAPDAILTNGIDGLIRGAVGSPVKDIRPGGMVNEELTEHLFPNMHPFPLDLAAMNIQRGRDHGLPPYNAFRELCGLSRITTWQQYYQEARDARGVDELARLYGSPDNLDLWVGGLMERPLRGAKIGRTFTCLLADQFRRVRDGDRFWYENLDTMGSRQIRAIKEYSLSKLLCNNLDTATWMPANIFIYYPSLVAQFERCDHLKDLDLSAWKTDDDGFAGSVECSTPDCICRYRIGEWRECASPDGRQYRTDGLVTGIYPPCTNRRVVSRACRPSGGPGLFGALKPPLFYSSSIDAANRQSPQLQQLIRTEPGPRIRPDAAKAARSVSVFDPASQVAVDSLQPSARSAAIQPGPPPPDGGAVESSSRPRILPDDSAAGGGSAAVLPPALLSATTVDSDTRGLELGRRPAVDRGRRDRAPPPQTPARRQPTARIILVPGDVVEITSSDGRQQNAATDLSTAAQGDTQIRPGAASPQVPSGRIQSSVNGQRQFGDILARRRQVFANMKTKGRGM